MKKRIFSALMCVLLLFSMVTTAPTVDAGGLTVETLQNVTAQSLYEFLGADYAELSGNTVKLINDFNFRDAENKQYWDYLWVSELLEDITIDLNGHKIADMSIIVGSEEISPYTFTIKDSAGGAEVKSFDRILQIYNVPIVIDGGTFRNSDNYGSNIDLAGTNVNISILSGSFYGGIYVDCYKDNKAVNIEKFYIADGVEIQGYDGPAYKCRTEYSENYEYNKNDNEYTSYETGHAIQIGYKYSEGIELTGNPIEIGAAVLRGGNQTALDIYCFDSPWEEYGWKEIREDLEFAGSAIFSYCKVKFKISKAAVLEGGKTLSGNTADAINVPEGSQIEWVDAPYSAKFTDIERGRWYTEFVDYVAEHKLMNGMTENTFAPSDTLTRAMFVQILANIEGVNTADRNTATKFTDVPSGKWFSPAVKWASENGIVNGMTENTFDPQGNIQRQQVCVMLKRYANLKGIVMQNSAGGAVFKDDALIQDYAKEAVYACRQTGIINGMTEDTFDPRGYATRAQIAKIMTVFHRDCIK